MWCNRIAALVVARYFDGARFSWVPATSVTAYNVPQILGLVDSDPLAKLAHPAEINVKSGM